MYTSADSQTPLFVYAVFKLKTIETFTKGFFAFLIASLCFWLQIVDHQCNNLELFFGKDLVIYNQEGVLDPCLANAYSPDAKQHTVIFKILKSLANLSLLALTLT